MFVCEGVGIWSATQVPIDFVTDVSGIFVEGLASVFSGLFGACHATTSYSQVAGFIAYTGVCLFTTNPYQTS